MAFWGTQLGNASNEPKRKYRWKVELGGLGDSTSLVWYAKTCDRPKMTISGDAEHKYLGHTFKFPGSVQWEDVSMTLVDPAETGANAHDAARKLLDMVHRSNYRFPVDTTQDSMRTINKRDAVTSGLKSFVISMLNAEGETIEEWTLNNAFITSLEFDQLDYASDDLAEITLTVKYDWAQLTGDATGAADDNVKSTDGKTLFKNT
jgi:hypothetical protein